MQQMWNIKVYRLNHISQDCTVTCHLMWLGGRGRVIRLLNLVKSRVHDVTVVFTEGMELMPRNTVCMYILLVKCVAFWMRQCDYYTLTSVCYYSSYTEWCNTSVHCQSGGTQWCSEYANKEWSWHQPGPQCMKIIMYTGADPGLLWGGWLLLCGLAW